jgi:hypothetical protein
VLREHRHRARVERDDPDAAGRLRLHDLHPASDAHQLLDYAEGAAVEVDVVPAEPADLAPSQAGGHHDVKQRVEPVVAGRVEKGADQRR